MPRPTTATVANSGSDAFVGVVTLSDTNGFRLDAVGSQGIDFTYTGTYVLNNDGGMTIDQNSGSVLPSIAVSSFRSARDIVVETDAISLGHRSRLQDDLTKGRLAILGFPWLKKLPSIEMGVAWKRERTLPPAARTFVDLIRARVRKARAME